MSSPKKIPLAFPITDLALNPTTTKYGSYTHTGDARFLRSSWKRTSTDLFYKWFALGACDVAAALRICHVLIMIIVRHPQMHWLAAGEDEASGRRRTLYESNACAANVEGAHAQCVFQFQTMDSTFFVFFYCISARTHDRSRLVWPKLTTVNSNSHFIDMQNSPEREENEMRHLVLEKRKFQHVLSINIFCNG